MNIFVKWLLTAGPGERFYYELDDIPWNARLGEQIFHSGMVETPVDKDCMSFFARVKPMEERCPVDLPKFTVPTQDALKAFDWPKRLTGMVA